MMSRPKMHGLLGTLTQPKMDHPKDSTVPVHWPGQWSAAVQAQDVDQVWELWSSTAEKSLSQAGHLKSQAEVARGGKPAIRDGGHSL